MRIPVLALMFALPSGPVLAHGFDGAYDAASAGPAVELERLGQTARENIPDSVPILKRAVTRRSNILQEGDREAGQEFTTEYWSNVKGRLLHVAERTYRYYGAASWRKLSGIPRRLEDEYSAALHRVLGAYDASSLTELMASIEAGTVPQTLSWNEEGANGKFGRVTVGYHGQQNTRGSMSVTGISIQWVQTYWHDLGGRSGLEPGAGDSDYRSTTLSCVVSLDGRRLESITIDDIVLNARWRSPTPEDVKAFELLEADIARGAIVPRS